MERSKELIEKFARAAWLAYVGATYPAARRQMSPAWETISKSPEGERWRKSVKSILLVSVLEPDGLNCFRIFGGMPEIERSEFMTAPKGYKSLGHHTQEQAQECHAVLKNRGIHAVIGEPFEWDPKWRDVYVSAKNFRRAWKISMDHATLAQQVREDEREFDE